MVMSRSFESFRYRHRSYLEGFQLFRHDVGPDFVPLNHVVSMFGVSAHRP
jgi:hypothetical protein